ncbi:DegT/DnrJ/EryC1/StrS family aminotransferase [Streptomyces sp. NPDC051684]|uniref:DegT/DnrJ/EryC1/StrS family aminotransferase n=1 Tax=Streptomyces sp. NPDC051684 TaxID=3365670 RepID=UPI0037B91E0B
MTSPAPLPSRPVNLADNTIGDEEIAAVEKVLRSGWLSPGPETSAFEEEFAAALGASAAVAVSSGTAALHLAVLALGLRPGDEVIVPSLSFVASAAVVALHGGVPVFADVLSETEPTVSPSEVERLIGPRTRAVVVMHNAGYPARVREIVALAARHGVTVIEDAAHAPVVRHGNQALGTFGDLGCFSFFATKNLTTGEGGMVVARDPELLGRVRSLRSHCLTRTTWDRVQTGGADYDVPGLGLNYRPTEISSAIGRVQLSRLPADRATRAALTHRYHRLLTEVPGLTLPFARHEEDSAYHLLVVLLPPGVPREEVRAALSAAGVQTSVHYRPTHLFSYYRDHYPAGPLPVSEAMADRLLSLPLHARLTESDVDHVVAALAAALARARPVATPARTDTEG